MGTVRFWLHDQTEKSGKRPINLIYSIHGQRKVFRTPIKLYEINWDGSSQTAIYMEKKEAKKYFLEKQKADSSKKIIDYDFLLLAKEAERINTDLAAYRKQVAEIEKRFELDNIIYSSKMIVDKIRETKGNNPLTKKEAPSDVVLNYIEKWINDHSTTRVKGSMTVYKSLKKHLEAIIQERKELVTFENIDHQFMQRFQNFLIERRNLSNVTVSKQISTLKTFLGYARKDGFKVSDRYKDFKIKQERLEVTALTKEEFEKLINMDLSKNKKYDQVRDAFCLACSTGLRYSDLAQLKAEHIYEDEIRITVQKTKELLTIPLTAYSSAILNKYKGMHKPIPVISNQKMNAYLKGYDKKDRKGNTKHYKGICEFAGINTPTEIVRYKGADRIVNVYPKFELIGVHTARKTFCTLSLAMGMSSELVMKVSGHSDYKSFQRYVHVSNDMKKGAMNKAWGKMPSAKLKAI